MGCISSFGRVILVILNLVFVLVSLVLIAAGVVLKFFAKQILTILGAVDKLTDDNAKNFLGQLNINLDELTQFPFLNEIGIALIAFGCLLFLIAFCGCCGACCQWKPLLYVFIILMAVLVLAQAAVGGLFLAKDSPLHEKIKTKLAEQMQNEYDDKGKDAFSFAINIMNYMLECCGITGLNDFKSNYPVMSCCHKTLVDSSTSADNQKCLTTPTSGQAPFTDFNDEGCYDKLQDKVLENKLLAGVILALLLLFQVILVVFAFLIVKDQNAVSPM